MTLVRDTEIQKTKTKKKHKIFIWMEDVFATDKTPRVPEEELSTKTLPPTPTPARIIRKRG